MLHVYYLKLSDFAVYPDDFFLPFVGVDTQEAVGHYKNAQVRRTKLLGETMARQLLKTDFNLQTGDYRIVRGEHGKPYIERRDDVFFNLSHSGEYVVCALSTSEVGVDIERKGKVRIGVARRFFHPCEVELLENLSGPQQAELFFRYWSVKESFLKYTGSGLSSPLSGFKVCFAGDGIRLEKEHSRIPVDIRECQIDDGYSCFVCSRTAELLTLRPFSL